MFRNISADVASRNNAAIQWHCNEEPEYT